MKTFGELLQQGEKFLFQHGIEDAAFDAKEIVLFASGFNRSAFSLQLCDVTTEDVSLHIQSMLQERANGKPLQYILGEWDFYGNTFVVFPGVLILRPETEELTDIAIRYIKENNCKTIYDVCAGTGCIGLSVAVACPDVQVYLFELYEKPLQCLRENAEKLHLQNVHIVVCDALNPRIEQIPSADVIISNPPYIPADELQSLQKEVLQEPLTALDGGEDGLVFYRALSSRWFCKLNPGGGMFFECAENQPKMIVDLFISQHAEIKKAVGVKDFYGLHRFVIIEK